MSTRPAFPIAFLQRRRHARANLRKNLYWVIWSVTIGMIGFIVTTGPVWSAFQRKVLGANDFQIGLISAIPVATCVLQVFISYYMEKKRNRRSVFLILGLGGRLFWIFIALVPLYLFLRFPSICASGS